MGRAQRNFWPGRWRRGGGSRRFRVLASCRAPPNVSFNERPRPARRDGGVRSAVAVYRAQCYQLCRDAGTPPLVPPLATKPCRAPSPFLHPDANVPLPSHSLIKPSCAPLPRPRNFTTVSPPSTPKRRTIYNIVYIARMYIT